MCSAVLDEVIYLFPYSKGCTVEVLEWIGNSTLKFVMDAIIHDRIKVNPC